MAVRLGQGRNFNPRAPLMQRDQPITGGMRSLLGTPVNNHRVMTAGMGINGELIVMLESRVSTSDVAAQCFTAKISHDFGNSWEPAFELESRDVDSALNSRLALGAISPPDPNTGIVDLVYPYWPNWLNDNTPGAVQAWHIAGTPPYNKPSLWSAPVNITSQIVKQNNATPAGLPASQAFYNTAHQWFIPTWSVIIPFGPFVGTKLWGTVVRNGGLDTTSRFYVFAKLPNGTFVPWGGLDESNATYDGYKINEAALAFNASGHLVGAFRSVSGSDSTYTMLGRSTNWGVDWTVARSGVGGTTEIRGSGTQHGLAANPLNRDEMYLTRPNDLGGRYYGKMWKSEDGGLTWPKTCTIYDGPFGYSNLLVLPDGRNIWGCFEGTHNAANASYNNSWQRIFNFHVLTSDPQTVGAWNPITYWFNEGPSGSKMLPGYSIVDYGGGDVRALGSAGWVYTPDGVNPDGVTGLSIPGRDAPGIGGGSTGGPLSPRNDSFVLEFVWDCTNMTASRGLGSNRDTGASLVGMTIETTAAKFLQLYMRDAAANEVTVTGATAVDTGAQPKLIRVERNKTTGKVRLYLNGVEQGTAGGTTDPTGDIASNSPFLIGRLGNGTNPVPTNNPLIAMRFSRGVATVGTPLTATPTKTSLQDFCGYNPSTSDIVLPSSLADCKLWINSAVHGGFHVSDDIYAPAVGVHALPMQSGMAVNGMTCAKTGKFFQNAGGGSLSRSVLINYDDVVGMHYRHDIQHDFGTDAINTPSPWVRAADSDFDFLQQSATFYIQFAAIQFLASGSDQMLMTTMHNSSSNHGLFLRRVGANRRMQLVFANVTNTPRIDFTFPDAINHGTWYTLGFWCTGDAQPVRMIYSTFPGALGEPVTYTKLTSGATVVGGDNDVGGGGAAQPFSIFAQNSDGAPCGCLSKDIIIRSTAPADDTEAEAWMRQCAKLGVWKPSNPARVKAAQRGFV